MIHLCRMCAVSLRWDWIMLCAKDVDDDEKSVAQLKVVML